MDQILDVDVRPGSAVRQQQVLASRRGAALERSSSGEERVVSLRPSQMVELRCLWGKRGSWEPTPELWDLWVLIPRGPHLHTIIRPDGLSLSRLRPAGAETCQRRWDWDRDQDQDWEQEQDQDRDQEQGRSLTNMVCLLLLL